jgi:two-component system NtrC family sensor kinase
METAPTSTPAAATVPAAAPTRPAGRAERRWLRDRWLPFFLLAVALPIAVLTAWKTLDWLRPGGRPFPGFFVMENGVVPTMGLFHWTGMTHGMPFAARLVAVDGRPVRSNGDVYAYVESVPPGTVVDYTIEKDGKTESRRVPTMLFRPLDYALTLGLFILDGFMGLIAGFIVSLLRPRSPAARGFLLYGFFWGLFPLTGTALYDPDLAWLAPVYFVTQAVFPATFIHFGLVFPIEREIVRRRPALLAAPYLVSAALLAWIFHSYFADPPSWAPVQAAFLYGGVSMPIFLGLLAYAYWENRTPMVRPRLQAVIPCFVIAAAAAIYGLLSSGVDGDFPTNLIAITPIFFFAALAYAIAAHDAFDINRLLRQTALYFALTLVIAATYAAILTAVSVFIPARNVVASVAFQVPVFVLFGFLFQPLRERLQTLIDTTFFRREVDYRSAVGDVSAALTSVLDLGEIFDRVGGAVTRNLALESFAAVLWIGDGVTVWRHTPETGRTTEEPAASGFERTRKRLLARHLPLALLDHETGLVRETVLAAELDRLGPALVVPIVFRDTLVGAFVLGRKRSGLPFSRDDLALLTTLAAQSAIAIQNACSYRSLQELNVVLEDRVHERTSALECSNTELARKHDEVERSRAELSQAYQELQMTQRQLLQSEKMAALGQLVAGVAHEINNPVSFIVGNLEPLRARLDALDAAAARYDDPELVALIRRIARTVETIGRGAERTAGIVQDLRTFSRVGDADRAPCDVHESLEVSLRLLKPKWDQRITIERDYGDLPPISAVAGQLNQVLMNLLANAFDAIPGVGRVRIVTACDGETVRISIGDDGIGISEEDSSRIFDPFFTTKPQGQGTGLGLSISHGIVEGHGGRIEVASVVGEGATFTVHLPVRPSKA